MNIGSTIGNQVISNLVDDLYSYLKNKASLQIKKEQIKKRIPNLINNINNVRFIKTLWQFEKAVDVESFYCDSHIVDITKTEKDLHRRKIDIVSDFQTSRNLVIRGIAGQGKSILLRHLFIQELNGGIHIPIFIELRRIQNDETLLVHIFRFLHILELPINNSLFELLSKSGKFVFFLDGFDEIAEGRTTAILNELEYLASIGPDCQFIITARPNSPIEMSSLFDVVKLDDLKGNEYEDVLRKLSDNNESANSLIKKIKSHKSDVSELLSTPLLVTLLFISYKSYQKIPMQLSDFYESIFITLLQRHDGTKPAYSRPRNCSLNDNQYRQIFDAFCFESKREGSNDFSYQQVYSLVQKAMSILDINEDIDNYIKDIKNVTCLLLEESNQYRFIHRSVQEYYCASFVRSRPENSAIKFYEICKDSDTANRWSQELDFLSSIDKYRHHKYYLLPLYSKFMGYDQVVDNSFILPISITKERAKKIFAKVSLGVHGRKRLKVDSIFWGIRNPVWDIIDDNTFGMLMELDFTDVISKLNNGTLITRFDEEIKKELQEIIKYDKNKGQWISVSQLLDEGLHVDEILKAAQVTSIAVYKLWNAIVSYLNREDAFIHTFDEL